MCFRVLSRTSSSLWIHICPHLLIKLSTWIAHTVCGMEWFPWFPHWPLIANNKIKHHIATKATLQLKSPKSSSFPFIQVCETNSLETNAFPAREFRWWQMAFFFFSPWSVFLSPGTSGRSHFSWPRFWRWNLEKCRQLGGHRLLAGGSNDLEVKPFPCSDACFSGWSHFDGCASPKGSGVSHHTGFFLYILPSLGFFFSPLSSKWSPLPWITCVRAAVFSFYLEIEEIAIHTCEFNICFLVPTQTLFLLEKKIFLSSGTPLLLLIFSKHCVHTAMQAGCAG